ncbi:MULTISPECIES: sensor histidine kinase [Paenibacillus]|uniref:histidine kinase n=1 Tax=Paenibacillus pabuli TaxID=1472 RepID=A0A855XMJ9_9BACL|nr:MULTISPECIES: ATP-binding protein [Paenibacillus]PWW34707.1 signal transduction histidine kinase [Paenibacillus pabuli]PXW01595.1 signal transduction histidine kinase [Paenibacillus taichungensis]
MNRKIIAALITIAMLFATYGLLLTYFTVNKKTMPIATNGTMDLTEWAFEENGIVRLDGQWEFYPHRLLFSRPLDSDSTGDQAPSLIQVPGYWAKQMNTLGVATYRLRVLIDDDNVVYGIKTAAVLISNRLIVNGQVVGSSGDPSLKEDYGALNKPYVSYFTLKHGWNDILVEVANHEFKVASGIGESIQFGKADQISRIRDLATAHDWVVLTAFLIMGLYFIGLFSQRRNDLSLVVFGLVCLFIAAFTSVSGERVLFDVIGPFPFWLYFRIQMVVTVGVGVGFFLYVYTAFRPYSHKWLTKGSLVTGTCLILLHLGFATQITTGPVRLVTSLYVTFALLYATYVFVHAVLHKVAGSWYLAVAAMALNALILNQNLNVYFGVPIYSLAPVEPFLVLLMLALLMSLRFSNAFQRIEELSEQLLEADKHKDDFLARTSHEFKTPLHGVMNISRSMLDDVANPVTVGQREKLQLMIEITRKLSQLVYDILDLSKLKQGEFRIVLAPVDVRSVVEVQIRFYAYLCTEKNIQLINQVPADLPLAQADENRISQVISNLLDNAIKHTEHGTIVVTGKEHGGLLQFEVRDTGAGIDPKNLPHIYEPFKSMEETRKRGFGLGLPIAKQLIDLQGGKLAVMSTLGVGTTFTFTLPMALQHSDPWVPSSTAYNHPLEKEYSFSTPYVMNAEGQRTVLIVDDQYVNLKVLLDALQSLNYRVIAVKDGYEALEQIDQPGRIDLVILDLMMPGMSGYEVCLEIRKRYSLLDLPVLMVTAALQPQDKVAAFQVGANDYLPKPFDMEELKARIGSLLAMKESLGRAVHMEVAFLQSQIKPHFLYNVLNSIVSSSYTDVERARNMIVALADYLRGSFRFSNTNERIEFDEEFQLIQTYVEIEQARFGDRICFKYDIPEAAYRSKMPPLLLQPLVENAVRHGIGARIEGGTVKLTAERIEGDWLFTVIDDGVGISPERIDLLLEQNESNGEHGVGLRNINKRLRFEYGTSLELASEPGRGTSVAFRIPDIQS